MTLCQRAPNSLKDVTHLLFFRLLRILIDIADPYPLELIGLSSVWHYLEH